MGNIYKKREQKADILKQVDKLFTKAARKEVKSIRRHFNKRDSWPLDFKFIKENVFFDVMGKHLEDYILPLLAKNNLWVYYDLAEHCILISKKKPKDDMLIIRRAVKSRKKSR